MRVRPMLGEFELDGLEYIESSERRVLVEHGVPGLEGSYFQDLGSVPNTVVIGGSKHGDDARDVFLEGIRELFNAGEPTTFVADINTGTDLVRVVIEDLDVLEVGGHPDTFRYRVKLRKYLEPPEPVTPGLFAPDILAEALKLTDAFDLIDQFGSIPNLGDPTPPVTSTLDDVETATDGLEQVASDLESLFDEDAAAAARAEEAEAPSVEPAVGEGFPSAEEVERALSSPALDPGVRGPLREMLSSPDAAGVAAALVQSADEGRLAGIRGDDSDVVDGLAMAHGVDPTALIPEGQDAALVLDAVAPLSAPPTIVVRSGAREEPDRLARALEAAGGTFRLWERGEVGRCDSTPSAVAIANLVPSLFCQVPAGTAGAVSRPTVKFLVIERYGFDQSSVQSAHLPALRRLAHLVVDSQVSEPIRRMRLVGHTDSVGDESYNLSLGRQRAANTRTALLALIEQLRPGLGSTVDVVVDSAGELEPLASNSTSEGRARNRRVEVLLLRTCQAFFAQYDLRFLPGEPTFGIPAHPGLTETEKERRTEDIGAAIPLLLSRRDARAAAALSGNVPPAASVPAALEPAVRRLSEAQLALYREYFPDGSGGIDFRPFQGCFEQFANGELKNPTPAAGQPPGVGEPDGGFYFLFAEFAFLCIESGTDRALWTDALRAFVKTQEIFMHVYRPAPHSAPPSVSAPPPAPGPAVRSLDDFHNRNFEAVGQSDASRKADLRQKYEPLDVDALRGEARDNMLRAQRMPPPGAPDSVRGDGQESPAELQTQPSEIPIDPSAPDLQIHFTDPRVDVGAKFALRRMIGRVDRPDIQRDAARLIRAIHGGTLAGIFGDDLGKAVQIAQSHGTHRLKLVPSGEEAVLMLDSRQPLEAPPTVIFRGDTPNIREDPNRIDPALQKASETFELFLLGQLGPCAAPGATPVDNLGPASFCRAASGRLHILVVSQGTTPVAGADVRVRGPATRAGTTDVDGQAVFSGIPPGTYDLGVEKEGFEAVQASIVVDAGVAQPTIFIPVSASGLQRFASDAEESGPFDLQQGGVASAGGRAVVVLQAASPGSRIRGVRIVALHFLSDHGIMHQAPTKVVNEVVTESKRVTHSTRLMDEGAATPRFGKPDWTPVKSHPVSQTKSTRLRIQLDIAFELVPGPDLHLQGLTSVTSDKFMEFEARFESPFILRGSTATVSVQMTSKHPLPEHIDILEGGRASWVLHIDGRDFHPIAFRDQLTTGPHKIFVTLGEPGGAMKPTLEASGDTQVITDGRLDFACTAARGARTAEEAADALFKHITDVQKVRYRAGFKWSPGPTPNDTAVEPKPAFHDYLWLCNGNIAAGECHFLAAAFVLAAKALGMTEELEVGVTFPWPRRINSFTAPDRPLDDFPFWGGLPGHRFQGRYQKFAQPKDTQRYFRTHEDEHAIDPATGLAIVERIRFRDANGFGNGFEAVARLGTRLYAIGEFILQADDSNFPGFSALSPEGKLHASATLFYAAPGNLNRGRFDLYFIDANKVGKDNTVTDSDSVKCPRPYIDIPLPHFRWES